MAIQNGYRGVWVGGWCVRQDCGLICGYCVWRVACCWTNRSRLVTSWPPTAGWLDLTSGLAFQSCFRAESLLVHSSVLWTVGWSCYCTASLQMKALTILNPVFKCFCPNKDASSVCMCLTEAIEFLYILSHGSEVYWTVHHCDSWRIKNQLDVTCYIYFIS